MIALALTKEEFDLLEDLVIQIRTIQSLHDGNVFKKKAVDILENRIIADLREYNEIILQTNPKPSSFTLHQDATANPKIVHRFFMRVLLGMYWHDYKETVIAKNLNNE